MGMSAKVFAESSFRQYLSELEGCEEVYQVEKCLHISSRRGEARPVQSEMDNRTSPSNMELRKFFADVTARGSGENGRKMILMKVARARAATIT
jgi:hypothetical protein